MNFEQKVMHSLGSMETDIKNLHKKFDDEKAERAKVYNGRMGVISTFIGAITGAGVTGAINFFKGG